jgi:hypothetical protein
MPVLVPTGQLTDILLEDWRDCVQHPQVAAQPLDGMPVMPHGFQTLRKCKKRLPRKLLK